MNRVLTILLFALFFNTSCDVINILNNDSGTILLFSARINEEDPQQLFLLNARTETIIQLTKEENSIEFFDWSKKAERIIYFTNDSDYRKNHLKTINIEGTNQRTINIDWANSKRISSVHWSPNGKEIVFPLGSIGTTFPFTDIYTLNIEGETFSQITEDVNAEYFPFWNEDGSKIYYTANSESGLNLYSLTIDGSNRTQLTHFNNSGYFRWYNKNKNLVLHERLDTLTQSKRQWNSYLYDVNTGESNLLDLQPKSDENNFQFRVVAPAKDESEVIVAKYHRRNNDHGTTLYFWNTETKELKEIFNSTSIGMVQVIEID